MKLAVMQPYFFPYLGYFQLIETADMFVLADEVQYIRHGWVNRNRILRSDGAWQYIIAPVKKHSSTTCIKDIAVVDNEEWKNEILKQLEVYRKAPFYKSVKAFLENCFAFQSTSLTALNHHYLEEACRFIGIQKIIALQSQLELDYSQVNNKAERVLQICFQLGARQYINLPRGVALYDKAVFEDKGMGLNFIKPNLMPYQQSFDGFEPALSIIDVMMYNAPEEIKIMIQEYQLI